MAVRVSPPKVFPVATGASKPPAESAGSADAFRQSGFVLGPDIELVLEGLNAEGAAAEASSGAKFRTQTMASALGLWSRSWLGRLHALHAIQWGNYAAATPLIRSSADFAAAMLYLLRTGASEWQEWLDSGGIAIAPAEHATQFRLHAFRAAEILAAHEILGPVYRVATDLALAHFGATLLVAGSDSGPDHVAMTFGDRDFHVGLAEIHVGLLLQLGVAHANAVAEFEGVFAAAEPLSAWSKNAALRLADPGRCQVSQVEAGGDDRYLVTNWRREPRSAPKRILL